MMENKTDEIDVLAAGIQYEMQHLLLVAVQQGLAYRHLKDTGALNSDSIKRTGSNEVEALQLIAMANEFERLLRTEANEKAALSQLIKYGWLGVVIHHALKRMGV